MKAKFTCLRFELKRVEEEFEEEFGKDTLLDLYEKMVKIRVFEEELLKRYENLEVRGELHLSIGQEAVAVGVVSAMEKGDFLVGTHRSHGYFICKGVDLKKLASEIYGKRGGLCRGKGGHMHLTDIENKILTTGIVGGGLPIASGLSFASRYLKKEDITVAVIGDGAANQGVFHETLNLSSLWSLPLLVVVEDNRYSYSLRKEESTSIEYNAIRGLGYGIESYELLEGNDVLQVYAIARKVIEKVRAEKKPVLLEVRTYRVRPHVEVLDDEEYRGEEEKVEWAKKDPIRKLEDKILKEDLVEEKVLGGVWEKARKEVREALTYAESSPNPKLEDAYLDVYASDPEFEEYEAREGSRVLSMYEAINEAITQEMERDDKILVLGEDVGKIGGIYWCTRGLLEKFGAKRVLDTPISESGFVGLAIGAAIAGLKPIVDLQMVDFSLLAMDQILNHMAKLRYMSGGQITLPIVLRAAIGGGFGGAAQHSQLLYSLFSHLPGLYVLAPSNPYDAKGLLISAIRSNNPTVFLEHKLLYGLPHLSPGSFSYVPEEPYTLKIGKARIVRKGSDATIITTSLTTKYSVEAAKILSEEGIDVEVVDLRSLKPLDKNTIIESVKKTGRVVIVDEDYLSYGLSGEVAAIIMEDKECYSSLKSSIVRLCNPDVPIPYSEPLELEVLPSVEKIVDKVREVLA